MNKRKLFTRKIEYEINENGCFICVSHKPNHQGYCYITLRYKRHSLHRHIYQELFGEIPPGMVIRHKCDNPTCINPEHLEVGTHIDNMRDMQERNRKAYFPGEKNPNAKLTEKQVLEIKELLKRGVSGYSLAKLYKVTTTHIYHIRDGKLWGWVGGNV